jgi:acyl phosphate:glycerol-3-phosphate acyltransferase
VRPYLFLLVAYAIGATPTSYWVGRAFYGVDLRESGSGNLGATNTFRVLGWKAAVPVVAVDMAKGWFPAWYLTQVNGQGLWWWAVAYGTAAIVGHMFSFWVGFRGGKGVATSGGMFLALAPWAVLVGFGVWLLSTSITRIVSVGSILAAATLPLAVWLTPHTGGIGLVYFTVLLGAFVIWAHRSNLGRLLRGEELGFRKTEAPVTPWESVE